MDDRDLVASIWQQVVKVVNKLIDTHDAYGFGKFAEGMNPTIGVVVESFKVIDELLKTLIASGQLDTDEYRQVYNSRQCIYHTRQLALALESDNEAEYQRLIEVLTKQAPI